MPFRIEDAVRILRSTPRVFAALFQDLPQEWLSTRDAPDSFSAMDVLGHLIYGEQTDWIPRARIILECGAAPPFDPFDRRGFLPLLEGRSSTDLLDMFADLRERNLGALESMHIGPGELELTGTHPALGSVTLRNLLASGGTRSRSYQSGDARAG